VVWVRDWDLEDLVSKVVEDSSTLKSVEVLTTTELSKTIIRTVRAGGVRTQTRILRTNEEVIDAMDNMAYNQEELEWIKKEVHSRLGILQSEKRQKKELTISNFITVAPAWNCNKVIRAQPKLCSFPV